MCIRDRFLVLLGIIGWAIYNFRPAKKVDFNAQIRPILNKKCLGCHGGVKQQSQLSFLFKEDALQPAESGKMAIVPGEANESELIKRISSQDPDIVMPPEGNQLTSEEIQLFKDWINQGAERSAHWAYIAPEEVAIPSLHSDWVQHPVDAFVLEKLQQESLSPNEPASKATLLRRVYFDLIGLPPTLEQIEEYMNDNGEDAYTHLVDQLLASPHFGERWAALWLDLARYADSKGYQKDHIRKDIWRYRDWVIDAFNQDMPFDQFTIEQLAGDLLESPTDQQILATAFHRNTMTNDEGGTDDEEFRVAAVVDRLNTTFEVWQGTTMSCVQCHSHPYDPIRHKEFYQLYSFFNTTSDTDSYHDTPLKELYSPAQLLQKNKLEKELAMLRQSTDTLSEAFQAKLAAFVAIQPGKVQVMEELPLDSSRQSFVFERGNWLAHGEEVKPTTPSFLPDFPKSYSANRLGLAKWLVDGKNPLTARVIVNRLWEQIFGNGLVRSLEDLGTQGDQPTHPKLLDWLAHRFVHHHQWSVKGIIKDMVLTATYQQSATITPEKLEKDPYNYLLSRGSRYRLSAEAIRDQALVIGGLFNPKVYGPSVKPYQPEGVWNVIRHVDKWHQDSTGNQHRRGLYTFWRRVSPYPSMMTFDSPTREVCNSRRIRTNTPLQALVTLNDPVFVEAAHALAKRMVLEGGETPTEKIKYGYRLALMEYPDEQRLQSLMDFYQTVLDHPKNANTPNAQFINNNPINRAEEQALLNVANVILNLDEVIMKG